MDPFLNKDQLHHSNRLLSPMITIAQLKQIVPYARRGACEECADAINTAMAEFEINTPRRVAAFIAQIAHESGSLRYMEEIASGEAYEDRKDLGNIEEGDGIKFKGRGFIQITGRANYIECSKALGIDLTEYPKLLAQPVNAARSAAWFWKSRKLNELADQNNFILITKRINGGTNGIKERQAFYESAKKVLGVC